MAEAKMQLYRLRRGPGEKGRQGAGNGENNGLQEQGTRSEKRVTRSGFRGTNGWRVSGFGRTVCAPPSWRKNADLRNALDRRYALLEQGTRSGRDGACGAACCAQRPGRTG